MSFLLCVCTISPGNSENEEDETQRKRKREVDETYFDVSSITNALSTWLYSSLERRRKRIHLPFALFAQWYIFHPKRSRHWDEREETQKNLTRRRKGHFIARCSETCLLIICLIMRNHRCHLFLCLTGRWKCFQAIKVTKITVESDLLFMQNKWLSLSFPCSSYLNGRQLTEAESGGEVACDSLVADGECSIVIEKK